MYTFSDTVDSMTGTNYEEHFCAEYAQLQLRLSILQEIINIWDDGDLDFTPACPRATYNFQLKAMKEYRDILEVRAAIEGIDLAGYMERIEHDV